jgi:hypothetical protein
MVMRKCSWPLWARRMLVIYKLAKVRDASNEGGLPQERYAQNKKDETPVWEFPGSAGYPKITGLYY